MNALSLITHGGYQKFATWAACLTHEPQIRERLRILEWRRERAAEELAHAPSGATKRRGRRRRRR